ncbi:Alpha/beta hydrolase fold-1 [Aspergillus avenaceus]|uniref:Alpha/beta hydrolase fold-1 n=1 Tax=Aspergillus avenaceus TaxID=36643 RepID=A0A5N6TEM3_ASPAV|nr:Alpha/beta hydrolase fold-1 [Aspergillus avenaceus]
MASQTSISQLDQNGSLYSIGTHSLFLSKSGVARGSNDPLVVFLAGSGDVASSYVAVERLVGAFAPVVLYDRSGLGRSERGPDRPTVTIAAVELHKLLCSANLTPPLILAAHSFGGMIAREYLHLYPSDVVGMVLADASTERLSELMLDPDLNIPAVQGKLNFALVTGLRESAQVTQDEWRARASDIARGIATSQVEATLVVETCNTLKAREQYKNRTLGNKPLSVIRGRGVRDYQRIYEEGVKAGNGTETQRAAFGRLMTRWDSHDQAAQYEQLQLSFNNRLIDLPDCGHNIQLLRPDVFANEVLWVWNQVVGESATPKL